MVGRRELERRLHALADIDAILRVMKNLALMETGKLAHMLTAQRELVTGLEETAAEFLAFYPQPQSAEDKSTQVLLLVGSQRGLCGDFNDQLLAALPEIEHNSTGALTISIGDKLTGRLPVDLQLDGPHAVEEIGQVMHAVMDGIRALLTRSNGSHPLQLSALYHDPESGAVVLRPLAPFGVTSESPERAAGFRPLLNIAPADFFAQLTEQHLLAAMTEVFHRSLMAENRFRLNHIEGATRRMERRSSELQRKQTLARQEEIIEEIEAILAGVGLDPEEMNRSQIQH